MAKLAGLRQDTMTPSERMDALFAGKTVDRVPHFNFLNSISAANTGMTRGEFYSDVERNFWAQVKTQEQYGYCGYPIYWFAVMSTWDYGGEIRWPEGDEQAPQVVRFPVNSVEDAEKLELPDVKTAGTLPIMMAFSTLQQQQKMRILYSGGGPVTILNLANPQLLLPWMKKKPELVHRLCRLTTDFTLKVAKHWVDTFGAETVMPFFVQGGTMANLISLQRFEQFLFPYWQEIHEKLLGMGIKNMLFHVCGTTEDALPLLAQLPAGTSEKPGIATCPHNINLEEFVKYFGDKCIVAGNIEPAQIMLNSPEHIYELCKEAIQKGKSSPRGFMLSAGCEIPPLSSPYNIYTMNKAVRDFGWYD